MKIVVVGGGLTAGPGLVRMDEFFRGVLATRGDPRTVVTDPHASLFGAELGERTLLPGADAVPGETRYRNWPATDIHSRDAWRNDEHPDRR